MRAPGSGPVRKRGQDLENHRSCPRFRTGLQAGQETGPLFGLSPLPRNLVKATDIRIETLSFSYEDFQYRTPIKFGGTAVDRATLLNVECTVRTMAGRAARGFGSMPLGNVWAFP